MTDNILYGGMVANRELLIRRKITIVKRLKNTLTRCVTMHGLKRHYCQLATAYRFLIKAGRKMRCFLQKIELLAPAGDLTKLKMAVLYGADAVYIGGEAFGLRTASKKLFL